jgi:hypothetical protein
VLTAWKPISCKFDYLAGRDWLSPLNRLPVVHGRLPTEADQARERQRLDRILVGVLQEILIG